MTSFNLYRIAAMIGVVIGVSLFLTGAGYAYEAYPEHHYSYSVTEASDVNDHDIRFENLSKTGQEAFLDALNGSAYSDEKPSELQ